uniref:Uncharacterized protein n=1 Tax=Solanum tuberosum TaxID=4113 RepID=M1D865_SOLTU
MTGRGRVRGPKPPNLSPSEEPRKPLPSVVFHTGCDVSYPACSVPFKYRCILCATSSRDVGSGTQHPDHA